MRQDQLEKARAARWRQDGNALVTLDDAELWLKETPLCLYLPRRTHLPVPAPSFVEAVAGAQDATPNAERLAAAAEMLGRLVASGAVTALSLFGAPAGIAGEQPDFLATPEALSFLYALQPDRNPKRAPSTTGTGRVSPLAAEAYKTLERDGAQTAIELRERLGREVTEAAVLRALSELWHTMRAVPVPATAADLDLARGAHWELLAARHRRELNTGSTLSQTTALAHLVSFYLQSAVAATGEEVEMFLSPVSSRARIRDVLRGLTTTRQLGEFSLGGNAQLYVEGTLPEIVEEEPLAIGEDAGLEQNEPSFVEAAQLDPRAERPAAARPGSRKPAFGDRPRTSFAARGRAAGAGTGRGAGDRPPRREGGFRKAASGEFGRRSETGRGVSREAGEGPRSAAPRSDRPRSERPSRTNRFTSSGQPRRPGGGFRRDAAGASAGPDRAAGAGRGAGARPPFRSAEGSRPPRPAGDRPFRKPFAPSGERSETSGTDRPFKKPYAARAERTAAGDRPFKKPFAPRGERPAGDRPFKKPYAARGERPAGGERPYKKPFAAREGASADRPARRSFPPRPRPEGAEGDRPARRPYTPRPAAGGSQETRGRAPGARPGVSRPGFSKPGGKPAFGKPGFSKPGFSKTARPAGKRFEGARPAGPGAGARAGSGAGGPGAPARPRPTGTRPTGARSSAPRSGAPRPGAAGRGGPASGRPRPGGSPRGAARPGGFSPPRRKPRAPGAGVGDEG
jgi:23S rRNA pseudouridine2605 synthase